MRRPRLNIQTFVVAVIFLAIASWAGPILVPEAVKRWKICEARADELLAESRSRDAEAARRAARSLHDEARMTRAVARDCERASWKYRRALLVPWEFWSLGGDTP